MQNWESLIAERMANHEQVVTKTLDEQIEENKHKQMLERSRRYYKNHRKERLEHSAKWDKEHPERRRERYNRWKAKQLKKKQTINHKEPNMAYLNKVMLIGNIGKDPEIRMSQTGGRKRVSFSLATSRRYRDNNGETKEQTDWHNIVGWGKIAEIFEQLGIRKGMSIYVEGALTNRSWTEQVSGQKRYTTEVNMDTFQLLTPRENNQNSYSSASHRASADMTGYDTDTELPF